MKYFIYIIMFVIANEVIGNYFEWPIIVKFIASVMFGGVLGITKAIEDAQKKVDKEKKDD